MDNFATARQNMVDSQIHPLGVIDQRLLSAYERVPREMFLPENKRGIAYADDEIMLYEGRYLMEAAIHARMVQALNLTRNDAVLDMGDPCGYSPAILSELCSTVIALEESDNYIENAFKQWNALGCDNIVNFKGDLRDGLKKHAPYDAILINGAVDYVPQNILDQLQEEGRLCAVVRPDSGNVGQAVLFMRSGDNFSHRPLFDAAISYLDGFRPKKDFVF